jgi:hypothetical protein
MLVYVYQTFGIPVLSVLAYPVYDKGMAGKAFNGIFLL